MKKSTTRIRLKGATDKYNSKKSDAINSGELFTFGVQIKRKDGKIWACNLNCVNRWNI